jgi:hypothetical protein
MDTASLNLKRVRTLADWQADIERYERSGNTEREFAAELGVCLATYQKGLYRVRVSANGATGSLSKEVKNSCGETFSPRNPSTS